MHVNTALTNIAVAYLQSADNFIATKAFPIVPSDKKTNTYYTYDRDDWFRSEARKRAPGTRAAGGGYNLQTATYDAEVYAVRKDIDDQIRANADPVINMDRDATQWVTHQLLIKRETDWASAYFAASKWTGSTTGGDLTGGTNFTKWDDDASTPIEDIRKQSVNVAQKTGYKPNVLVLGPEVHKDLIDHPDILERIKYTQKGVVSNDLLATLFDVERVLVPYAVKVTTAEAASSDTYAFVYGKSALLVYSAPAPSVMAPSGGYQFVWTGYHGAQRTGMRIKRYREEPIASDVVEGEMSYDFKLVAADLGVFFTSAVN